MAKAKLIPVGNGYSLRFDQRAKGQETPYWIGKILKDGKEVGFFSNEGTGGPTTVRSLNGEFDLSEVFEKMAKDGLLKAGAKPNLIARYHELDAKIVEFAHAIGYEKGWKEATFEDFCKAEVECYREIGLM